MESCCACVFARTKRKRLNNNGNLLGNIVFLLILLIPWLYFTDREDIAGMLVVVLVVCASLAVIVILGCLYVGYLRSVWGKKSDD